MIVRNPSIRKPTKYVDRALRTAYLQASDAQRLILLATQKVALMRCEHWIERQLASMPEPQQGPIREALLHLSWIIEATPQDIDPQLVPVVADLQFRRNKKRWRPEDEMPV